ncbi:MAG: DUF2934 domain-containing protein [Candidatus Thiodiazotropha sp.]
MGKKHKKDNKHSEQELEPKKKNKKAKKQKASKGKKAGKSAQAIAATSDIDPEMRHQMIATAAYYIAEKHGFDPAGSVDYWQQAEREIDRLLGKTS